MNETWHRILDIDGRTRLRSPSLSLANEQFRFGTPGVRVESDGNILLSPEEGAQSVTLGPIRIVSTHWRIPVRKDDAPQSTHTGSDAVQMIDTVLGALLTITPIKGQEIVVRIGALPPETSERFRESVALLPRSWDESASTEATRVLRDIVQSAAASGAPVRSSISGDLDVICRTIDQTLCEHTTPSPKKASKGSSSSSLTPRKPKEIVADVEILAKQLGVAFKNGDTKQKIQLLDTVRDVSFQNRPRLLSPLVERAKEDLLSLRARDHEEEIAELRVALARFISRKLPGRDREDIHGFYEKFAGDLEPNLAVRGYIVLESVRYAFHLGTGAMDFLLSFANMALSQHPHNEHLQVCAIRSLTLFRGYRQFKEVLHRAERSASPVVSSEARAVLDGKIDVRKKETFDIAAGQGE